MEGDSPESVLQPREQETLKQLTELLRSYGEKILSGQSKLSLTTRSLCILNDSFASLHGEEEFVTSFDVVPPNSPKLHLAQDIQFLYDFMQKTIALKILHISSTLQGRVNLGSFKALRTLEIKKTPLHLLEGIQRMRGRLSTIICARSLSSLQELFETCGGDLSSPMSWPELRTACLSFNMIEKLDSSLRLVPGLEVLDLSHNSIKETDRCLEYLTEVSLVNLGYNKITHVPTFAISARAKLSTLILRNNNLEHLNGIDDLVGLRDLDVANNCLCVHETALLPLRALHRLGFLVLKGNPLSYHDQHRSLTIIHLNRTAANRVTLDGRAISQTEIQTAQKLATTKSVITKSRSPISGVLSSVASRSSLSSLDMSFDSGTLSETDGRGTGRARRGGRSTRRVRRALISNLESECEVDSEQPAPSPDTSKPSTPATTEHLDVKKHLETMRNQLGPDWLQTLAETRTAQAAKGGASPSQPIPGPSPEPMANGRSSPQPEPEPENQPLTEESPLERVRLAKFAIGSLDEDEEILTSSYGIGARLPPPVNYNYPRSARNSRAGLPEATDTLSDHIELTADGEVKESEPADVDTSHSSALVKSAEFETIYDQHDRTQSHSEEVDYGVESEPFIVSHLTDTDTQHLISVTQRYLLEKDINGDVIEALDLRCLQDVQEVVMGAEAEDRMDADSSAEHGPVIKLTFDHVRKDKKERLYIAEDDSSVASLLELLQPIVENNQAEASLRDQMHCLKCSREFSKQRCSRVVRSQGTVNVTSEVFSSSVERGDLTEVFLCPFCSSDMLIKVDNHLTRQATIQTPVGSFKEPMATSSANPSPWKRSDSPIDVPGNGKVQSAVGSLKSTQEASSFYSAAGDTAHFHSPKDSVFLTPNSSQSDLYKTITDTTTDSEPHETKPTPPLGGQGNTQNIKSGALKTVYMSQSVIEVSTQHDPSDDTSKHSSVTTPTENKAFQRNHSNQDLGRYRKRQDSGSSDILVLSRHPNLSTFPSQESDITVLSNPSQSSIAVIDSAGCSRETLNDLDLDGHFLQRRPSVNLEVLREGGDYLETDLSPAGSLTNKTLSSMVSSVYEKSIFDANSVGSLANESETGSCGDDTLDGVTVVSAGSYKHRESSARAISNNNNTSSNQKGKELGRSESNGDLTPTPTHEAGPLLANPGTGPTDDPNRMRFCFTDYSQIDHRLKLYFMMSVCNHNDEELLLVNRCGLWHYAKAEEFQGLVVVTSHFIYFFKIVGRERVDNPEKWLKLVQSQQVVDLCYINIGLGYQTIRLEFTTDSSCFVLLIRDEQRCKQFTSQFTAHVQSVAFNTESKLEGISKNNPVTLNNLRLEVLEEEEPEDPEEEETLVRFVMAYQHTGEINTAGEKSVRPVSVVVTPRYLHLVDENLQWPPLRGSTDTSNMKGHQFTRKDRQKITDITQIDLYQSAPLDANIVFYDEELSEECAWRVTMETSDSLSSFVKSVKELWDEQFGVDLHINTDEV